MQELGAELSEVLEGVLALDPIALPLLDSLGCVLANDITAQTDVPEFATAAIDGFAIRTADQQIGTPLRVIDDVPAGFRASENLIAGTCIKVAHGAPIPESADAVVSNADSRIVGADVVVDHVSAGHGITAVGATIKSGSLLAHSGRRIEAEVLGMLARAGVRSVDVHPRPRVLVVTVGTEYVEPGVPTSVGLVSDHLSFLAAATVTEAGGMAFRIPPALDEVPEVVQLVEDNAHRSDLIVLCGIELPDAAELIGALNLRIMDGEARHPTFVGTFEDTIVLAVPDDPNALRTVGLTWLPAIIDRLMGRIRP